MCVSCMCTVLFLGVCLNCLGARPIYFNIVISLYHFNFLLFDFVYNHIYPQLHINNKMKNLFLLVTVFVLANSNFLSTKLNVPASSEVEDAC